MSIPGVQPSIIVDSVGRRGSFDPFSRWRVSQPHSLFDSKQIYDDNPLDFVTAITGSALSTYVNLKSATELTTGATSGNKAIRQTRRYWNYQSGKGLTLDLTFNLEGGVANVTKRVGYYDADNGVFLQLAGASALSLVARSKVTGVPVETVALQAAWSIDPMDGTGPSGKTLVLTNAQQMLIGIQWLGAGSATVYFFIDNVLYPVHQFHHANLQSTVWMQTPNLPLRWEIENTGVAAGAPKLTAICGSVIVDGGVQANSRTRSANRGMTSLSVPGTLIPLISLRLKASHNRATVNLARANLMNLVKEEFLWQLILNPTVTGGLAASWVGQPDSAVEIDTAQDGVVSGGHLLESGYQEQLAVIDKILETQTFLASDFAGSPDVLMLAAQSVSGVNATVLAGLTWIESQ